MCAKSNNALKWIFAASADADASAPALFADITDDRHFVVTVIYFRVRLAHIGCCLLFFTIFSLTLNPSENLWKTREKRKKRQLVSLLDVSACFFSRFRMSQGISMWERSCDGKMSSSIDSAEKTSRIHSSTQSWRWKRLWHIIKLSDGKWRRTTTIKWLHRATAGEEKLRQSCVAGVCVYYCLFFILIATQIDTNEMWAMPLLLP